VLAAGEQGQDRDGLDLPEGDLLIAHLHRFVNDLLEQFLVENPQATQANQETAGLSRQNALLFGREDPVTEDWSNQFVRLRRPQGLILHPVERGVDLIGLETDGQQLLDQVVFRL